MRRADRLFRLVQLLRGRRLSTARFLAERLEVSLRTVYRDVADLQRQAVPIEGEAGVGYRMAPGYDLPPLMFSTAEAQALVAAARIARSRVDDGLASALDSALSKIVGVLPAADRAAAEGLAVFAPPRPMDESTRSHLAVAREAIAAKRKLELAYRDLREATSRRTVRPLACVYWGEAWTLAAWCETREAFRSFRVDRVVEMAVSDERFRDEPGRSLADLLREVGAAPGA